MKKKCPRCEEKVKNSFSFCPSCGIQLKKPENYGLLGKNDFDSVGNRQELPFGGMMNKMIGGVAKMLEKELAKEMKSQQGKNPNSRVRLMINGKEITPGKKEMSQKKEKVLPIEFSSENLERWKKLKKEEPVSNLSREDNVINYEMDVPDVESVKDVSIIELEKGLEVRAVGKKKAYQKRIPIDLPLTRYSLVRGLLTLQMDASGE